MADNAIMRLNPDASELATIERMAALLVKGCLYNKVRSPEQAATIILLGRDLGISAVTALANIHVIDGKPSTSALLIAAQLARGGVTWDVERRDIDGCVILFHRKGRSDYRASFVRDDAQRAVLLGKDNWRKYPADMHYARAMTSGARIIGPDLLCGLAYTPDELGVETDVEGNPVGNAYVLPPAQTTPPALPAPPHAAQAAEVAHAPAGAEVAHADEGRSSASPSPAASPPPVAGVNGNKSDPKLVALKRRARALQRDLGWTDEEFKARTVALTGKDTSTAWTLDDARTVNATLDAAVAEKLGPPPDAREPGDDVAPEPSVPFALPRDERIREIRAMLPRLHAQESSLAMQYMSGATTLDALDDAALERAAAWVYDFSAAKEGA